MTYRDFRDVDGATTLISRLGAWRSELREQLESEGAADIRQLPATGANCGFHRRAANHDLRNMLQVISSGVRVAQLRVQSGQIEAARAMARQLAACVKSTNLLAMSARLPSEEHPEARAALDVGEALREMAICLEWFLGPRIRLEHRIACELPLIHCVEAELQHALLNLAINARDAMPAGGKITLTVAPAIVPGEEQSEGVLVRVRDEGQGMPRDVRPRVFDPFFSTKRSSGGQGLGLASVATFVRGMKGRIEVEETSERGTSIVMFFPAYVQ